MLDFGMGAFNLSYHFAFLTSVRLIIISPFFLTRKRPWMELKGAGHSNDVPPAVLDF